MVMDFPRRSRFSIIKEELSAAGAYILTCDQGWRRVYEQRINLSTCTYEAWPSFWLGVKTKTVILCIGMGISCIEFNRISFSQYWAAQD